MSKRMTKIYKFLEIARYFPVIATKFLLDIELPLHQKDMLQRAWKHKYTIFLCSRRTGKTFIMSIFILLQALLFPDMKIGIVAPVFRQAKTVFDEVENLVNSSSFAKSLMIDEPKHTTEEWYIQFSNGSKISALPLNDNIRSYGFNIIVIDEYGFGDNMKDKMENILEPMLFTKRDIKTEGNTHPTDVGNRLIVSSTATFKFNDYYRLVTDYADEIEKGSEKHDIISYDYRDGLESGIFEKEMVLRKFKKSDSLTQKMEYLNIFPDDSDAFISYETLQRYAIDTHEEEQDGEIKPSTQLEFEQEYDEDGNPTHEYIMAFDDADVGDNFAIAVIKLEGKTKKIVRIVTLNDEPIQKKVRIIRQLLRKFNIKMIVADQRNRNIKDNLAEPYTYSDGEEAPIIVDIDDEDQQEYVKEQYGSEYDYEKLIKIHNFSGKSNEMRARHFLGEIENSRVKFPAPIGISSKKEEDAFAEIKATWAEIVAIQPKVNGKYVKYETPTRKQKKDRWTVCELGVWASDEYLKKMNSGSGGNVVMGIWNE